MVEVAIEDDMHLMDCEANAPEGVQSKLEPAWRKGSNAKQYAATLKGAFGTGSMPVFPVEVGGKAPEHIDVYGDGTC